MGKCLQRVSSTRKPPGLLLGSLISKLAQNPLFQQGPERQLHVHPIGTAWMEPELPPLPGHRSRAGSVALWLLQHSCRDCAHVAQLWAVHKHCLSLSYFSLWRIELSYEKVKENLQNLFCFQGALFKKKKKIQQYLKPNVWIQTSSKSKANNTSFILFYLNWTK